MGKFLTSTDEVFDVARTYPEVSIVVIARPQEPMLARAILSALAQRNVDVEVCVILDGPCVDNRPIVDSISDLRLRVHEFDACRGRGAARAFALEFARGKYITFVDADDWLVSTKLETQLAAIGEHKVHAVSTSLLIVDQEDRLRGIRRYDARGNGVDQRGFPVIPFAPLLVSRGLAMAAGFDSEVSSSEDRGFLHRLIPSVSWMVLPDPLYVYDEYSGASFSKIQRSLGARISFALEEQSPFDVAKELLRAASLGPVYAAVYGLGFGEWDIERRSRKVQSREISLYATERDLLVAKGNELGFSEASLFRS